MNEPSKNIVFVKESLASDVDLSVLEDLWGMFCEEAAGTQNMESNSLADFMGWLRRNKNFYLDYS